MRRVDRELHERIEWMHDAMLVVESRLQQLYGQLGRPAPVTIAEAEPGGEGEPGKGKVKLPPEQRQEGEKKRLKLPFFMNTMKSCRQSFPSSNIKNIV